MNYKEKVMNNIIKFCEAFYEPINKEDMVLGDLNYNRRCHLNAVQYVEENKAEKVYLVAIITDTNGVIVHFINQNKMKKYIDNTLGWTYKKFNYYIIGEITSDNFQNVSDILINTKRYLVYENSNFLLRKLFNIDYNNFV